MTCNRPAGMAPLRRCLPILGLIAFGTWAPARAQSLPALHPINPVAESRSGLYFQPYVPAGPGWRSSLGVDYGSILELAFRFSLADTTYLLDAEVLRLNLAVAHDLDARHFLLGEAWVGGTYDGFLDGFLNWYHGILGITDPGREGRPANTFGYQYKSVTNQVTRFRAKGGYLGDLRIGIGRRHHERAQSVLSLTLPTSTAGAGFARGTPSLSLLNSFRVPVSARVLYEGSFNVGYTPRHGALSALQQRIFFLGTSGVRIRTIGRLWSFGNVYVHSPYMSGSDAAELDRWDVTIDFGWMIRSRSGREFRFGMTEDLAPGGPAVDANFRVGYSW